jgi:hypothetical protein
VDGGHADHRQVGRPGHAAVPGAVPGRGGLRTGRHGHGRGADRRGPVRTADDPRPAARACAGARHAPHGLHRQPAARQRRRRGAAGPGVAAGGLQRRAAHDHPARGARPRTGDAGTGQSPDGRVRARVRLPPRCPAGAGRQAGRPGPVGRDRRPHGQLLGHRGRDGRRAADDHPAVLWRRAMAPAPVPHALVVFLQPRGLELPLPGLHRIQLAGRSADPAAPDDHHVVRPLRDGQADLGDPEPGPAPATAAPRLGSARRGT